MEYRYRDKAYLTRYMLDTKLFDMFGIKVEDAVPIRTIYILATTEGAKILKKVDYSTKELLFIYNSLEYVRREYPFVVNYRKSIDGNPYVRYENETYAVLDVIEGRECSFELPSDLKGAAEALSNFHEAGKGIDEGPGERNRLSKLIQSYKLKSEELLRYKSIAEMHQNKTCFDKLFLEYVDSYTADVYKAGLELENSEYRKLCENNRTFCHHDLAYHNILIDDQNRFYFIDFDYAIIDLPYHDLANLIVKAIKHIGWCSENAFSIIEAYTKNKKLTKEELKILYAYLLFPQDFYDISMNYYMRTRNWEEEDFADKLKRKAEYREERDKFLKDFKTEFL